MDPILKALVLLGLIGVVVAVVSARREARKHGLRNGTEVFPRHGAVTMRRRGR
jgi:hypothetical protein